MFTDKDKAKKADKPSAAEKSAEAHAITEGQPRPATDDNADVKAIAECPSCGYQLHSKQQAEQHCAHCGRDYTMGKGDKCPNCSGTLR